MRHFMIAGGLALLPAFAFAQNVESGSFRGSPQFVSYTVAGQTTSQIAVPMLATVAIGSSFSVDIATAFASTQATAGSSSSTLSGLTDTQVRGNYAFGSGNVVLTFGLNVPTGKSSLAAAEIVPAQAIGIDFYTYPVAAYGSGLAGTLGVAFAGNAGDWELGAGASMRKSTEYQPVSTNTVKFTPGDEYRVRVGGQRAIGEGRLGLGLILSSFGTPKASDLTTLNTGTRAVMQAVFSHPLGSNEIFVSMWDLYTGSGKQFATTVEASNIINLSVAYGIRRGETTYEPNLEVRMISQGSSTGNLMFPGVRMRIPVGSWTFYPGAAAAFGTVVNQSVSGFRVTLGAHWRP